ncbi:MAG: hypothetical protein V4726_17190 [Verrucomicrobiota bacterium]
MSHENERPTFDGRGLCGSDSTSPLQSARRHLRGVEAAVSGVDESGRAAAGTRQGRALWRWAQENSRSLTPDQYLEKIDGGGQEHRVWHDLKERRYWKATYAGHFGWVAGLDFRYNKRSQEDEPFIGMGEALPLEYLDRLILQNEVFADDIRLEACAIEKEGLVVLTSQPFVRGRKPKPAAILETMLLLGFERIPGLPANTEDSFSFYRRPDRVSAFDAHTGNFILSGNLVVPIDLVMVRAGEDMHDYLCRRIDAARN